MAGISRPAVPRQVGARRRRANAQSAREFSGKGGHFGSTHAGFDDRHSCPSPTASLRPRTGELSSTYPPSLCRAYVSFAALPSGRSSVGPVLQTALLFLGTLRPATVVAFPHSHGRIEPLPDPHPRKSASSETITSRRCEVVDRLITRNARQRFPLVQLQLRHGRLQIRHHLRQSSATRTAPSVCAARRPAASRDRRARPSSTATKFRTNC